LVTRDSSNPGFQRTLALAHEKLGDVEAWEGRVDSGVAHARLALAGFSAIASAQPDSVRAQLSAVISTVKLADLLGNPSFPNLGDAASALHYYEVARTRLESPPLAGQTDAGTRRYVGLVQERLGSLFRLSGQWADALQAFARSLSIREALAESERGVNSTRDVAVTRQNLCEIQVETREFQAAASNCRRSHELFEELWTADPHNLQSADDLARSHASGARLNASVGNWAGAARELAQTVALRDSILVAHPENVRNHQLLGAALLDLVPYYVAIVRAGGPGAAVAARQGRAALQRAELMLQVLAAKGLATDAERARLRESARSLSILASR